MSALAALRRDPVARLESEISATDARIAKLVTRADELEAVDEIDAAKIAAANREIEAAKSERVILDRALASARAAQKKEAARLKAAEDAARRDRLVARAEALRPRIIEALVTAARLLGENKSITDLLSGPDAMRFWYQTYAEEASRAVCKGTRPKVARPPGLASVPLEVVTDTMVYTAELRLDCPKVDVE